MDLSLGVTALSILQQPEKLQWEVVASVLEDTVKDLEELGVNPSANQSKSHSLGKPKENVADSHTIPFPCLLAGGLFSYSSGTIPAGPPNTPLPVACRTTDGPLRNQGPEPFYSGPLQDRGPMEIETCGPPPVAPEKDYSKPAACQSTCSSPAVPTHRTVPVLLLYSIRDVDEKISGQVFGQMNNAVGKGLHEEGFTVPQIIEMEFDTHEQLLLQDPPITYIQQFADAATNLSGLEGNVEKWSTLASATVSTPPRPGALVQCLRLPKQLEEENLHVDSITPCWDGAHLLVSLQHCCAESTSAPNQVETLNNLNRLHSALCSHRHGDHPPPGAGVVDGHHQCSSASQSPLILPPEDQQQLHRSQTGSNGGYLALYKVNYATRIVTLDEEPIKVHEISDPSDAITSLILLPPDVLDTREDDSEETPEDAFPPASKTCSFGPKFGSGAAAAAATSSRTAASNCSVSASTLKEVSGLGHLVLTTHAGYIMIMDLSTLEVLTKVEPPKKEGSLDELDPFVSVTFCSGTDRLCACTKGEYLSASRVASCLFVIVGGAGRGGWLPALMSVPYGVAPGAHVKLCSCQSPSCPEVPHGEPVG